MHVDTMSENVEVSFAKEFKRLLDLHDKISTKGDKKHAKFEAKSRLKHKQYWVHKEEYTLFNGMEAVYKIVNNQDKVTMKHFYHIICNPDLDEGFCAMQHIPCAYTGCVGQLSKPKLPNLDKTPRPRYAIEIEKCNYSSILLDYNKWYITKSNK